MRAVLGQPGPEFGGRCEDPGFKSLGWHLEEFLSALILQQGVADIAEATAHHIFVEPPVPSRFCSRTNCACGAPSSITTVANTTSLPGSTKRGGGPSN